MIGSQDYIRAMNRNLVLHAIYQSEPISRAALSNLTHLTKATISSIVQELITMHLVIETGMEDTQSGRKPILLCKNRKIGYVVSIELGYDHITCVLCDLSLEIIKMKQIISPTLYLAEALTELILSMLGVCDSTPYGLIGITIACENQSSNTLSDHLFSYFKVPVYIERPANLAVLYEQKEHNTKNTTAAVLLTDHLVSFGMIQDDIIITRNTNLGMMMISPTNMKIQPNPLTYYVSMPGLLSQYCTNSNTDTKSIHAFLQAVKSNLPKATAIIDSYVTSMAIGIQNISSILMPQELYINSFLIEEFPDLIEAIRQKISCMGFESPALFPSANRSMAVVLGGVIHTEKKFTEAVLQR